jgi:hypothetical protein
MRDSSKRQAVRTSWVGRRLYHFFTTTFSVGRTDIPSDVELFISVKGYAVKLYVGGK